MSEIEPSNPTETVPNPPAKTWASRAFPSFAALAVVLGAAYATRRYWMEPPTRDEIEAAVRISDWRSAEKGALWHLQRRPSDPEMLLVLARTQAGAQRFEECIATLERLASFPLYRSEAMLRIGDTWMQLQRRRKAEGAWLELLTMHPQAPGDSQFQQDARNRLCRTYAIEKRRLALLQMSEELFRNSLPSLRYKAPLMRLRYRLATIDEQGALSELEPAMFSDETDLWTARAVALYHQRAGRLADADLLLARVVEGMPEEPEAWSARLACLIELDFNKFLEVEEKMPASVADRSADCLEQRAVAAEHRKDFHKAADYLLKAVEIEPAYGSRLHRLGQMLQRVDDPRAAKILERSQQFHAIDQALRDRFQSFERSWAEEPEQQAELAYEMGRDAARQGLDDEARMWFQAALSVAPIHQPSIDALEDGFATGGAASQN